MDGWVVLLHLPNGGCCTYGVFTERTHAEGWAKSNTDYPWEVIQMLDVVEVCP